MPASVRRLQRVPIRTKAPGPADLDGHVRAMTEPAKRELQTKRSLLIHRLLQQGDQGSDVKRYRQGCSRGAVGSPVSNLWERVRWNRVRAPDGGEGSRA